MADSIAQKLITTSINDNLLQLVMTSSTYMWDMLLSIFEQKPEASLHFVQQ